MVERQATINDFYIHKFTHEVVGIVKVSGDGFVELSNGEVWEISHFMRYWLPYNDEE